MTDINKIREFIKVQRKYASFWEWFKREKDVKELGVVKTLLESIAKTSPHNLTNLRNSENDPPDCIADADYGSLIGFEVRELVDQQAVEINERGRKVDLELTTLQGTTLDDLQLDGKEFERIFDYPNQVYRDWTIPEVVQELQKIITEKDSKTFKGEHYQKLILVIPTAEPVLIHKELKPILDHHVFNQTRQLNEAYLLFQYDPESESYPYIQLNLAANNGVDSDAANPAALITP